MDIPLDLSKHCIHTEIKRLYSKSIGKCLRGSLEDDGIEERIETLREALEKFDFGVLRTKYRELGGGSPAGHISLVRDQAGRICIKINDTEVIP
jgi:hypothetical protein